MRILSVADMRAAEKAAVVAGTSYEELMENAGTGAARAMQALAAEEGRAESALFLCGAGNNAGDAFVTARHLAGAGWRCTVWPLAEAASTLARRNALRLPGSVEVVAQAPAAASFLVDGVFGIGFHGQLPPKVKEAFRWARAQSAARVALDIPSGLSADMGDVAEGTFAAHHTYTFGAHKPGLLVYGAKAYTGRVTLIEIGL